MDRKSNARQTRSQTRALLQRERANLHDVIAYAAAPLCEQEARIVSDSERIETPSCTKCKLRSNTGDLLLCEKCNNYWHCLCASVSPVDVDKPFTCSVCAPQISFPPVLSTSSRCSTSSARQKRIARELERLEEERRVEENIQQQNLAAQRRFIARKYELLSQQDDDCESVCSKRNNPDHRIVHWINEQQTAAGGGANCNVVEEMNSNCLHSIQQPSGQYSIDLQNNLQSTPTVQQGTSINHRNCASLVLEQLEAETSDIETAGSIIIGESEDDGGEKLAASNVVSSPPPALLPISPVNVEYYDQMLDLSKRTQPVAGVRPKMNKNASLLESWRFETVNQRKLLELEHKKDKDLRRRRGLELTNQLKRLEIQKREEQKIQLSREADLKAQLQKRERENAI